ncbi:MAG: TetR/AcrR family transcriptional regulator [Candidatus Nanohaloarchaea archaeon]
MNFIRKDTEDRQEEILKVSLEIIHEEGQSALTVRNIAEEIGISEAAVYRHFEDKQEIVRSLSEKVIEQDEMPECVEFDSAERMMESILECLFESIGENPEMTAVIFHDEFFNQYDEVREMFREHRERKEDWLKDLLEEGKERGIVGDEVDSETFSTIMAGTVMMSVRKWREGDFSYSLKEEAGDLAEQLSGILES